jgi:hypothetical protein
LADHKARRMEGERWKKRKGGGKGKITISNHRSGNRICTKETGCTHAPIYTQILELRVLKDLEGYPPIDKCPGVVEAFTHYC